MLKKRTDLALEAKELWEQSPQRQTKLPGVEAGERDSQGFRVTTVKILNEQGEKELCKPKGAYVTIELDAFIRREDDAFTRGAQAIAAEIRGVWPEAGTGTVLVAGLGNRAITPDAVGPETLKNTLVTNHLVDRAPEQFGAFRRVSALETGVLGTTGVESAELIRAVSEKVSPSLILAVDALASRCMSRVCRTVQITDTGIVPGSGVGNSRDALNRETLGVPVIALGVPTVVDAATLALDMAEEAGGSLDEEKLRGAGGDMIVTPREIDARVREISRLVGYGINLALHEGLTVEDVDMFLG